MPLQLLGGKPWDFSVVIGTDTVHIEKWSGRVLIIPTWHSKLFVKHWLVSTYRHTTHVHTIIAERLSARHLILLYCRFAFVCIYIYVCPSHFSAHARFCAHAHRYTSATHSHTSHLQSQASHWVSQPSHTLDQMHGIY